jgi:Zn-dependent protease/predicted transcriptional regulator
MKWSWRIARVAGIGIHVHVTFFLILLWVGTSSFLTRHLWSDAVEGMLFVLVLFAIVVLHELGHALTARRFGIGTRDITLLPIGGVARLERMPEDPRQELLVALAGPAVNVCLAVFFFAIIGGSRQFAQLANIAAPADDFLGNLVLVNIVLALFNLVPAFPMDGGRVLRALLAMRLNYVRATTIAARIGQTVAVLFGFAGFCSFFFGGLGPISNPFLVFIGVFVWMGAAQEAGQVRMKSALGSIPVNRVMITDYRTLAIGDSLGRAVEFLLTGWQQDFPILEEGRVEGLLTRAALAAGLSRFGPDASVQVAMEHRFPIASPLESVDSALTRMRANGSSALLVVDGGVLVGILTSQNVNECLAVQTAVASKNLSR